MLRDRIRWGDLRWWQEQQLQGAGGGRPNPLVCSLEEGRILQAGREGIVTSSQRRAARVRQPQHRPTPGWDCCTLSPGHPGSRSSADSA